ncbi:MAG TPA: RDD family protein [Burkholderiaceae bacterium]|nr:RDD family protein [Burkholderiaceae bacterium]
MSADPDRFHAPHLRRQEQLEGMPLASFGARAAAFLVDGGIVAAVLLGLELWRTLTYQANTPGVTLILDFGAAVGFVVTLLYFGLSTYIGKGATIGKRLLGIRVVSLVHSELSLWHSIERALGYAASTLEAGFGFLQYFKHPNRQTVHDRIAETIVVVDPRDEPAEVPPPA